MKNITFILILSIAIVSCNSNNAADSNNAAKKPSVVTNKPKKKAKPATKVSKRLDLPGGLLGPKEFNAKIKSTNRPQIIDLRTHAELHRTGPIQGAMLVDYNKPGFEQRLGRLNKDKPVFIYCAGGNRSEKAYEKMSNMGFEEIYDLKGGINAWVNAGMKVQSHSH